MTANALAKQYDKLEPDERFALILAANARGDETEGKRLADAAGRVTFSVRDYAPHAEAFHDVAEGVFMELMDLAAGFIEAAGDYAESEALEYADAMAGEGEPADDDGERRTMADRCRELWLAAGFMLKVKADGWKLFCQRRGLPPFALWEFMPGWARLQRHLTTVEGTADLPGPAWQPAGMVKWLNRIRPAGEPDVTEADLMTPEGLADDLDTLLAFQVNRHGG